MLVAILSLVGVAVGALLQHVLSRSRETEKQLAALRDAAYVDYLQGVVDVKFASDQEEYQLALRKTTAAKARIAIYGTDEILAALANFEQTSHGNVDEHQEDFARMVAKMRGKEIAAGYVKIVLFGADAAAEESARSIRSADHGQPEFPR